MSTALVVSGGGSHGAFAVGAVKELRRQGITFDIVAGSSTGALIAPLVATDEIDLLEEIYATAETDKLITRRTGLDAVSQYKTDGLATLIDKHIDEQRYQRILESPTHIFVATVCLEDSRVSFWNPRIGDGAGGPLGRNTFKQALLASASIPVMMPPVRIAGEHHVDGGVRELAPLSVAIHHGAETIYAVVLSPEQREPLTLNLTGLLPVFKVALATVAAFTQDVLENNIGTADLYNRACIFHNKLREKASTMLTPEQVDELFREDADAPNPFAAVKLLELFMIRPEEALPASVLEFVPAAMRAMIANGESVARRHLDTGPIVEPVSRELFERMLAEMRQASDRVA